MHDVLIRETNYFTWEIGLFFALVVLLAIIKQRNTDAFHHLVFFWKTDFYGYESSRAKMRSLKLENVLVFVFRGLVFAGFCYKLLINWGYEEKPWLSYPFIFGAWLIYTAARALSEWGIGLGFGVESRVLHLQLRRASIKAKLSFVLSIMFIVGVFGLGQHGSHWNVFLVVYVLIFLWTYLRIVKPFYGLIKSYLIYFILYICMFEIAPLWLIVKYLKV